MNRKTRVRLILFTLWLIVFSASSQVMIIAPILPEISAALDIPEALQSWLVGAYAVMLAAAALTTGPISDKIGRRRILIAGSAAMSLALLLHGPVTSFAGLMTARAVAGIAGGILSGSAVAYIGDYFPYERRGWATGWVTSGIAAGQILGVSAGKMLAAWFGFRYPFLLFGVVMAVAAFLVWRAVPQPDVQRSTSPGGLREAVRGYARLATASGTAPAVFAYMLMFAAISLFVIYMPTWLEGEVGLGDGQIALLFMIGGLCNVVTGPVAGRLSDRIGRKPLVVTSCLGMAAVMIAAPFFTTGFVTAAVMFGFVMVFVALRIGPLLALMTELVPSQQRGVLMSLSIGVGNLGHAVASFLLVGPLYAAFGYVSNALAASVAMLLMAALVYFALPEPELRTASSRSTPREAPSEPVTEPTPARQPAPAQA